jgi:UPF0176 protein
MSANLIESFPAWKVLALYRFVTLENLDALKDTLQGRCDELKLCGTILLAHEGINGTIAGEESAMKAILEDLETLCNLSQGEVKSSYANEKPFRRMKVQIKKEIVTMRTPKATPAEVVGTYVNPQDWNALLEDPDVLVLDTRNEYEMTIGTFKNAVNPHISSFTEFVPYVENQLDPTKTKKVAMFCTGGIRCEKASSFMLNQGFETVYHLKGGILKYLEEIPPEKSLWDGACFVFDRRVAVGHGLAEDGYEMCFHCGWPLKREDRLKACFEKGVSCLHCVDLLTPESTARLRIRQRQSEAGLFE